MVGGVSDSCLGSEKPIADYSLAGQLDIYRIPGCDAVLCDLAIKCQHMNALGVRLLKRFAKSLVGVPVWLEIEDIFHLYNKDRIGLKSFLDADRQFV